MAEKGRRKRILVAPAAFKGTLSAGQVAAVMSEALSQALDADVMLDICPVADGGDDTLAVLAQADPGFAWERLVVCGPKPGTSVEAQVLWHPDRKMAVVEAAQAHGLKLLAQPTPMGSTSYGVGELIRRVIEARADMQTLVVTVGGSASTDGGLGALQALGARFLDSGGRQLKAPLCGGDVARVAGIELPKPWPFAGKLLVATDVVNPLLGLEGTATVFAPQKGASPNECRQLEAALAQVAELLARLQGVDLAMLPGMGAAGGLAFGLRQLPRSAIVSGVQWLSAFLNLDTRLAAADLLITGEGRLDATSLGGKATGNLLLGALGKPVFVFCGQVQPGLAFVEGVRLYPLADSPTAVQAAMEDPQTFLQEALRRALPQIQQALAH